MIRVICWCIGCFVTGAWVGFLLCALLIANDK